MFLRMVTICHRLSFFIKMNGRDESHEILIIVKLFVNRKNYKDTN